MSGLFKILQIMFTWDLHGGEEEAQANWGRFEANLQRTFRMGT